MYYCHEILLRVTLLENALCSWIFFWEMEQSDRVKQAAGKSLRDGRACHRRPAKSESFKGWHLDLHM